MQDVVKICDICGSEEIIKITVDDPKPITAFERIQIGRGKSAIIFDLCTKHYLELRSKINAWIEKTAELNFHNHHEVSVH